MNYVIRKSSQIALILNLFIVFTLGEIDSTAKFLNDLIKNEKRPSVLNIRSCWIQSENIRLAQLVNVPIQFYNEMEVVNLNASDVTNKMWFVIKMDCSQSLEFLKKVEGKYFARPYNWILLNSTDADRVTLRTLGLWIDSNMILVSYENGPGKYGIEQIYKREQSPQELVTEGFGNWSKDEGFHDARETRVLARRRRNLMQFKFEISMVIIYNDSLNHLSDLKDPHLDSISKATHLIIGILIDALNATRHIHVVPTWGYKDPKTGKILGMVGDLLTRKVHMGGTCMFFTPDRVAAVDYVSETTQTFGAFVFRAPPLTYTSNIYYLPLSATVWFCSILLVILCTIVMYITYKYSVGNRLMSENRRTVSDFVLIGISTICQMGSEMNPKRVSGRISTIFFCVAMLFIYTSYTANIVALLQSSTNSINTLKDLLQTGMGFGVEDTPYHHFWFPTQASEPIRQAIYKTKIVPPNQPPAYVNLSYGVSRLRQGLYAFHMELSPGYKLIAETFYEHEKCGLKELDYMNLVSPWFVVAKHSPYKELIKTTLFKMRENGLQARVQSQVYRKRPQCEAHGQNFESVRLIDCYAALLVLAYGFIASILLLVCEIVLFKDYLPRNCCQKKAINDD